MNQSHSHDLILQRIQQIQNTQDVIYRMLRIIESQEQSLSSLITDTYSNPTTNSTPPRRRARNRNTSLTENLLNLATNSSRQTILSAFYIPLNELLSQQSTQQRGLTQTDINNTTTNVRYRDIISPINTECPISQETFDPNEQVLQINSCRHIFQRDSLLQWFRTGTGCPLCRIPLNQRNTETTTNPPDLVEVTLDEHPEPNTSSNLENSIRNAIRNRPLGQITPDTLVNSIFDIINNYSDAP